MKKFLFIFLLLISFNIPWIIAQNPFEGFLKPVAHNTQLQKNIDMVSEPADVWLFRPAVSVSAIQLTWNKDTKGFDSQAFESGGMGIGYQHYIWNEGVPYNNYGFNLLLLFPMPVQEQTTASLSLAGTVTAFRFVNIGGGYNFTGKVPFILTGISYNF